MDNWGWKIVRRIVEIIKIGILVLQRRPKLIDERLEWSGSLITKQGYVVKAETHQNIKNSQRVQRVNDEQHYLKFHKECNSNHSQN